MATSAEIIEYIKSGANEKLNAALNEDPSLANGKTDHGITFLLFASYYRNKEAVEIIKKKKIRVDIFEAAGIGAMDIAEKELSMQPDLVNAYSADGFTPLGLACYFSQKNIAKYFMEHGADVNLASDNQFKVAPIHSATSVSDIDLVELLIAHGADVNAKQLSGFTPLHAAAFNGKNMIVKMLADHGADINAKTDNGQTPLDKAKEKGFKETMDLIVALGGK